VRHRCKTTFEHIADHGPLTEVPPVEKLTEVELCVEVTRSYSLPQQSEPRWPLATLVNPVPTVGFGACPATTDQASAPIRNSFGFQVEMVTDCVVPMPVQVAKAKVFRSNGVAVFAPLVPKAMTAKFVLVPLSDTAMVLGAAVEGLRRRSSRESTSPTRGLPSLPQS
jgi:hypothetical protein